MVCIANANLPPDLSLLLLSHGAQALCCSESLMLQCRLSTECRLQRMVTLVLQGRHGGTNLTCVKHMPCAVLCVCSAHCAELMLGIDCVCVCAGPSHGGDGSVMT
jgi:hypothetical protein